MNFNRRGYRDDLLFVIALVLPAVVAATRYLESERQMDQIARVRPVLQVASQERDTKADLRVAYAQSQGR
jgi:hypothetical protein